MQDALREELEVHLAVEGADAENPNILFTFIRNGFRNISDEFQDSSVGLRGVQWR